MSSLIIDTPLKPAVITSVTVAGLSQPLVDVAAILSMQNKGAFAQSLAEAAWILEKIARSPSCMGTLTLVAKLDE